MKLTKLQKAARKEWAERLFKIGGEIARFGRVTVALQPTCRGRGEVAWAICSPDETPKRKYGEWVTLERLAFGFTLPIELDNGEVSLAQLEAFATAVCSDWAEAEFVPTPSCPSAKAWPFPTTQRIQ